MPDNVLFADQAGEVFEVLMEDCDVHTVLRLPRGTFSPYSEGTKTNVIFFTKGRPTERTWIYDARANVPKITKKMILMVFSELEELATEARWKSCDLQMWTIGARHPSDPGKRLRVPFSMSVTKMSCRKVGAVPLGFKKETNHDEKFQGALMAALQ